MAELNRNRRYTLELNEEELLMLQECVSRTYMEEKSEVGPGFNTTYVNKLHRLFGDLNG